MRGDVAPPAFTRMLAQMRRIRRDQCALESAILEDFMRHHAWYPITFRADTDLSSGEKVMYARVGNEAEVEVYRTSFPAWSEAPHVVYTMTVNITWQE